MFQGANYRNAPVGVPMRTQGDSDAQYNGRSPSGNDPLPVFAKRLSDLTSSDIHAVVAAGVQEGAEVEFKETLPAKGAADPWIHAQQQIGDRARNELLAEVIAFANAYGGTMVLGVAETDDKPPRAKAITPLPKCIELAERLRLQCRDCIEPQIPMLEVSGIPTSDDGSGVVVFRSPRSRMAPHRHTVTRECFARRADRTEKMTMREIQDLTLQVERGIAALEAEFAASAARFGDRLAILRRGKDPIVGMRATGVPIVPLFVNKVHGNEAAKPPLITVYGSVEKRSIELLVPARHINWRPILRGSEGSGGHEKFGVALTVRSTGILEYVLTFALGEAGGRALYPGWVMGIVTNIFCAIERFRRVAGAPEVEYALELEIQNDATELPIGKYGGSHYGDYLGPFPGGRSLFPRYSVGGTDEFGAVTTLIQHDFWNAAGHAFDDMVEIDFKRAFDALGLM